MTSIVTPPYPGLIAILLVTLSRGGSGPQITFHYPHDPFDPDVTETKPSLYDQDAYEDTSSSSDSGSVSDEYVSIPPKGANGHAIRPDPHLLDDEDDHRQLKDSTVLQDIRWQPTWEPLLGLGSDGLSSILAPDRTYHKRRFELGINDLCFLGWPVFAKEDGSWRRRQHKRQDFWSDSHPLSHSETRFEAEGGNGEEHPTEQGSHVPRGRKSSLMMFNVVFVLEPPLLEHNLRVQEMYDNVVKKFVKALKYEQGRSEYVARESELIQSVSAKHMSEHSSPSALYTELLIRSPLAKAISTVFAKISTSRIASITLSPTVSFSVQIPLATSTSVLPSLTDLPGQPGLWLTTANELRESLDLDTSSRILLVKHFTLLLKSTKARIREDIRAAGGPREGLLSQFITALTPTKSLYKISMTSGLSLEDIGMMAQHLIEWRRATAIPPLNQRDTYIMSPNADMSKLRTATKAYEASFPTLPSLPKMLAMVSGTPKPWGFLIPSSDHKEAYYDVLAWLLRDGWVTQLRTTAFIRASPDIKRGVLRKEEEESKQPKSPNGNMIQHGSRASPLGHRPSLVSRPSSDGRATTLSTGTSSSNLRSHLGVRAPDDPRLSSLVWNPNRASALEATWLDAIAESLLNIGHVIGGGGVPEEQKLELKKYWPLFVKYFHGEEALERIPVREGLKRKVVWEILGRMGLDFDGGVEKENGGGADSKGWLVTVRHW